MLQNILSLKEWLTARCSAHLFNRPSNISRLQSSLICGRWTELTGAIIGIFLLFITLAGTCIDVVVTFFYTFFVFHYIQTTSNMVFLGDNQNSVCILSAPEVVGICLRSIVALGSLSLPTPSSSASSHNCVGSCRYSATNNLNILFNFSTVGKWTVLRLSPILCHCLGNGVAITWRIGTPENKTTML